MQTDPSLSKSILKKIFEDNPRPEFWNEELKALVNPSIHARPLNVPLTGQIAKRLNNECEYYWAFDRCGANPNHERVENLRFVGFDYATTKDVQMCSEDTVKAENEIRSGDRRLMKCSKQRWLEIRKDQVLRAIAMGSPQGKAMGEDGTVMGVNNMLPGVNTRISSEVDVQEMHSRAAVSDAAQELASGQVRGNASVAKVQKGA